MVQFISFAFIFGGMMFIWTFVFLNRSHDKTNQSFLYFLSLVIIWIVLSVGSSYFDSSLFSAIARTMYWYSMLMMSVLFLLFVYRLLRRKLDAAFYIIACADVLTIFSRYLYPLDYSDPTFWRLSDPVAAPAMSLIFSIPAIFALLLVLKEYFSTRDKRRKAQLGNIFVGTGFALLISVSSEYVLPTLLHINLQVSLMYYAIFVFVLFIFVSIMKYRLLYIRSDYIYTKLFLNSIDGIIIVNKNSRIININHVARQILKDEELSMGQTLTDYIQEYSFEINYTQQEMEINTGEKERFLSVTQYPIDTEHKGAAKLVMIKDISDAKLYQREKDRLLEKSTIDRLTEVYNRQYFVDKYCGEEQEGAGVAVGVSLLFIDVDDFKMINDRYGHLSGDKVLADLAQRFKRVISCSNEIIRFGGDEFVILLPEANAEQAYEAAARIRDAVNEAPFQIGEVSLKVTVSIGVIEGHAPVNNLVMKADIAMYQSKVKGKNTVTLFSGTDV